ncbi:LysR family transcriptional regulator [Xanthomonas phaseoli pv. phaseoli]|uniref:LysR family transcriptional regulator n=1 Tax=Xanthomonas campestris pv. phaseoli TaxID=317013 RepID=A0AB34QJ22_XANCH|nr:LysR family transcriptional regulator [Xanthomonas phaseoli]KHS36643.1 LysR family transcriptional regulator [Xanthomonas phaseoli pv. phaseoli]MDM4801691.1 LysR family transcriptional regulator [Xanthomonas phaseoli pv. phaseoli]MDM4805629.1 LysR family transcriptional regulator [Xanthomonas phaseoli pv. phaseoli]MDM4809758.1 LysR family transcriptional regulator [Xanthomonas phaseoli pv. phaseoli]QWN26493.1 LysR family transcriptional regulator [Xanthomonas phaseoli pv. phaseoli]
MAPTPRFSYKSDRLKPLRAFCQTVRLGSVSRAAEALYVSQPAVTLQLQALERDLGVPLFERSGRRMAPSREGQLLYDMAQPLVESLDGLEAGFREKVRGLDAGELNIAANSSTILYLLPRIVANFRAHHPDVRLTLHNAISADGTDLLREDAVDLAVGSMLDVPADLNYAPVYRFEQLLITPPDHPLAGKAEVALQDLSPYPLILPPRRQVTYRLVDLVFQQARVPYTVALEVGGWEVIKQYVAMGMGISIVTAICLTDADRDKLATRSLKDFFPTRSYGVVVRKGKYLSPQARAFIELIQPDLFTPRGYDESGASER